LSDDGKRKQFDTWGATSEQMGGGQAGPGASQDFSRHQNWNFQSSVEEFAESRFGFGAAQEVKYYFSDSIF
jgi:DnaJ family protein A protein 3